MAGFCSECWQRIKTSLSLRWQDFPARSDREKGTWAEELACDFLRQQGYAIIARNYLKRFGEIDLIGWDGDILAFIEVKYRAGLSRGYPQEAVTRHKRRKICRVAAEYRIRHKLHDINYRYDVVSILGAQSAPHIELIKDAFKN
jgi:putative endonuclease